MSLPAGSGFAFTTQAAFGALDPVTTRLPFINSGTPTKAIKYRNPGTVAAADSMPHVNEKIIAGHDCSLPGVQLVVYDHGMGEIFGAMFPKYGFLTGTHSYTYLTALDANTFRKLSIELAYTGDTSEPMVRIESAMCFDWQLGITAGDDAPITLGLDFWARQINKLASQSMTAAIPANLEAFTDTDVVVTVDAAELCVEEISFSGSTPYRVPPCLGAALNDEPEVTGLVEVTGNMKVAWDKTWSNHDKVMAGTPVDVVVTATAPLSGNTLVITATVEYTGPVIPAIVAGDESITTDLPFRCIIDTGETATNAFKLAITNADGDLGL